MFICTNFSSIISQIHYCYPVCWKWIAMHVHGWYVGSISRYWISEKFMMIVRFYHSAISTSAVFVQSFFDIKKDSKSTSAVLFLESELLSILCLKASQDSQLWKVMVTVWLTHMAIPRSTVVRLCETCRSSMLEEHSSRSDQMLIRQRPCMAEDCCLCCYATGHGVVLQNCSRITCTILVSS